MTMVTPQPLDQQEDEDMLVLNSDLVKGPQPMEGYKAQAHLYTIIKVARDEDLMEQIGKDIHFDLVDHDKVHNFRIKKQMPFNLIKEEVAKEFGIPVQFQRFWIWAKRQNHTYRPNRPLTPQEEAHPVGALREISNRSHNAELKLFLEVERGQDLHLVPPPQKNKKDILLFFKLYDPKKEELRYVGRLFVKNSGKPIEILPKLNHMAGFAPDEEIELFEEIKFEPSVMCERLDKRASFRFSQLEDGDIVCFQKRPPPESEEKIRFLDVPSFLEYVKNRQIVHFRALERPKEDEFSLELAKNHTYDNVVERVAQRLYLDDPSKIRLTCHNCYSQQPKPNPIKYRSVDHLLDMLVHYNQISDILYYEVLDIPLPELQCLKTLKVAFHHATKDEAVVLNIRLPKQITIGDVLNEIKTKVELSHPSAELRLLEVFYHKIYKIFPPHEKIETINGQYFILRAEEIPEEEKNLGPNDRLIHVYHFTKESAQNQVQVMNFGEPFFLVIHEGETLTDVKVRIQKKLQVPDEEFSKWKFAFLSLGHPEYLDDSDVVSSRFQRGDVYGAWGGQYLGLEHSDTTPKRAYAASQMEQEECNTLPSFNLRDSSTEMRGNNREIEVGIEDVTSTRKLTSTSWNHFKRFKIDGCQYGKCKYCGINLKVPSKNGTSSLSKHYRLSCKKKPGSSSVNQSPAVSNKRVIESQELKPFNEEETRRELAMMVVLHDYPLSMVEHVGFRRFVASFQSSFQMISRNTLKNDIMKIYGDEKTKCYKALEKLKCRIAITTDMWTSGNNKKSFMAITGHYIDDSWVLQSCILRFIYVPAPHTAKALSQHLVGALIDWNIDRKLSTITVDNCMMNDAMIDRLLEKLPKRYMPLDGKVIHMRCCAHIHNLIAKEGLGIINDSIERIRDSVVFWTASPSRVEKFEEHARQLSIGCTKKLSLDCKTRWNSTYLMLETAIIYKDVFSRVKHQEKYYKDLPTDEDWVNALEICAKLKTFYRATEMFSGTLYPTANIYFPIISNIKVRLNEWVKSPNWMIRYMADKMLEKYDKYWETCHIMMAVAAVLDPRYKMVSVEFYFQRIYGEQSQSKIHEIRRNCYELLSDYQSRGATMRGDSSNTRGCIGSTIRGGVSGATDASTDDSLDDEYDLFVASRSAATTSLKSELDVYLEESVLPRTQNLDVLSWWKINGLKYPTLQTMARDILAIPVSTVASESAFSTSGRLLSPHWNRLHSSTVEALMCSHSWLWKETNGTCSKFGDLSDCPTILDEEEEEEEVVVVVEEEECASERLG